MLDAQAFQQLKNVGIEGEGHKMSGVCAVGSDSGRSAKDPSKHCLILFSIRLQVYVHYHHTQSYIANLPGAAAAAAEAAVSTKQSTISVQAVHEWVEREEGKWGGGGIGQSAGMQARVKTLNPQP